MLDSSNGIDLDLYQVGSISSNYSSKSNVLYKDFYSKIQYEEYLHDELYETFISSELSDSSSENETNDCNINSQHKYSFYFKVYDAFNSFEVIGKKLDKYAIERGFAVRKGRTHKCENGSVWNAIGTTIRCSLIDDDSIHNHSMDPNIKNNAPRYYRLIGVINK
ncbi:9691_t:CDS:2, partial [Gigaspora margarita]